jgi:hypothetical protein
MFRYMLILVSVVGMMGSSSFAFAGDMMTSSGCEATIKCVCEGPLGTRVVPCPTYYENPAFYAGHGPRGTLGVDCSQPLVDSVHASCEDLNFKCKWWYGEHKNCLLTLPLFVASPGDGDVCIPNGDGSCSVDEDCCSGLLCDEGTCCGGDGLTCTDNSECCTGASCIDGSCTD